jgi:hypothetical protein
MAANRKSRLRTRASVTDDSIEPSDLPPLGDDQVRDLSDAPETIARHNRVLWQAMQDQIHTQHALKMARRALIAAEWKLHEAVQGAKAAVIDQYGADSPEARSLEAAQTREPRHPKRLRTSPDRKKHNQ